MAGGLAVGAGLQVERPARQRIDAAGRLLPNGHGRKIYRHAGSNRCLT